MRQIGPDLLSKLNSNEQTAANKSEPKMSVQVSRARTTVMDSTYWTVETIRTKAGLGDISLAARRLKAHGRPDRLYEIHVDGGQVKTTIREYPDLQKDGWQPQFELGAGSAVAIAFDGEWELWRKKWRLKTVEEPWIFWVDASGVLWAQLWDDVTTKVELASGVVNVKAIRAWKTLEAENRDQGIVVGYIKSDGKVYYRQYIQFLDLTYTWDTEHAISEFTGTAESLNLFITHDFRMGFTVSDSTGNAYWYITNRNYSAMTTGRDVVSLRVTSEALLDIGEIETLMYQAPADIVSVNASSMAVMGLYEDGETTHELSITGEVIDERHFKLILNTTTVELTKPEWYDKLIPEYTVESLTIVGNVITVTTLEDIETLGFTTVLTSGVLLWRIGSKAGFVNSYAVKVDGFAPPIYETLTLLVSPSATLTIFEITKHLYNVLPIDTVSIYVSAAASLTINEASTDPV